MSRKNIFQKLFIGLFTVLIFLIGHRQTVKAQFFGINLDTAIGYSTAKKGVIGGSVGITHPFPMVPNIGFSTLKFEEIEEEHGPDEMMSVMMNIAMQ